MSTNKKSSSADISLDLISAVKSAVKDQIPDLVKDNSILQSDIDRLETDEWLIRRFIKGLRGSDSQIVINASNAIISCLKWRHKNQVDKILTGEGIPKEMIESGFVLIDENEKLMIFRTRFLKKSPGWMEVDKIHLIYVFEKFDQLVGSSNQGKIIFDLSGACLANMDHDMATFMSQLQQNYYPEIAISVWYFDLPWYLKPAIIILTALSSARVASRIIRVSRQQALELIPADRLPDFLGGNKVLPPMTAPPNSPDLSSFAQQHNLPTSDILMKLNALK